MKPLFLLFLLLSSLSSEAYDRKKAAAYLRTLVTQNKIDLTDINSKFDFNGEEILAVEFDDVISENLDSIYKDLNQTRKRQYTQDYLVLRYYQLFSRNKKDNVVLSENIDRIMKLSELPFSGKTIASDLNCPPEQSYPKLNSLFNEIRKVADATFCTPLEVGTGKTFVRLSEKKNQNNYTAKSPDLTTGNYHLKRTSTQQYEATLGIRLSSGKGTKVSSQEMINRIKACINEANPFITGPKGENLKINILTPEEIKSLPVNERPAVNNISIVSPGYRANSQEYPEDISCSVITHEVFHQFGLCDEYQETDPTLQGDFSCRVITSSPSVMRDEGLHRDIIPKSLSCPCDTKICQFFMNSKYENIKKMILTEDIYQVSTKVFIEQWCKEESVTTHQLDKFPKDNDKSTYIISTEGRSLISKRYAPTEADANGVYYVGEYKMTCQCPDGNSECLRTRENVIKSIQNLSVSSYCPFINDSNKDKQTISSSLSPHPTSIKNGVLTFYRPPKIKSFLQPKQFAKILEGNCPGGESEKYTLCSQFAYKSKGSPECKVPNYCFDDSSFLGVAK